jgi:hypothetical protein
MAAIPGLAAGRVLAGSWPGTDDVAVVRGRCRAGVATGLAWPAPHFAPTSARRAEHEGR